MKKVIIAAVAMAASVSAFAQVSAGVGYLDDASKSVYTYKDTSTENKWGSKGFYLQGTYTLPLTADLDLNAGLKFSYLSRTQTGTLDIAGFHLADAKAVTSETYLSIPVTASYGYKINKDLRVFAFAGPTLALGLSSKIVSTGTILGQAKTVEADNYQKDEDGNCAYNRANLFLGAGLGVDVKKMVRLSLGYDCGLLNRTTADNTKLTQNQFHIGIAYLF